MRPRNSGDLSSRGSGPSAPSAAVDALADTIPAPLLALARSAGREITLSADTRLFAAGEPVPGLHLVISGAVRIMRDAPGRRVVVHHEGPGGLLGEVAFFSDGCYPATAVAGETTTVVFIPTAAIHRGLASDPALAPLLLRRLAERTRHVIERLDRIANLTVMRRLALHLCERGAHSPAPVITLGMTQLRLAEELGTVKEVITRELRALVRLELIAPAGGGRYRLLDADGLRRVALTNDD